MVVMGGTGDWEHSWHWCLATRSPVRVVEVLDGPGSAAIRVWDPSDDQVRLLPAGRTLPIEQAPPLSAAGLIVGATAARIHDAIARNVLLAPLDAPVLPLPHQIAALQRALERDPVRMLLADEVGLGKTIEAGLILRELKLRDRVRRVLVVAPKGLTGQWVAEMQTHFEEQFELVLPAGFAARSSARDVNPWQRFDQVVTSLDAIKPLAAREGWTAQRLARYNRDRFEAVAAAGWVLIVVDEAHRIAGATSDVARHQLGRALAAAASHVLLLSATPHNGRSESFHRLMALLDERAFPTPSSVVRERVLPYVARTEKRAALDVEGRPLFLPRSTRLRPVAWDRRHQAEERLYEAVSDYVREGYNRAMRERRYAVGFLLILFQRLVTSSTRAIRVAMERRLAALGGALPLDAELPDEEDSDAIEEAALRAAPLSAGERREVQGLLELARQAEMAGVDAKAQQLLDLLVELEREELDPQLKLLVFTEFTATQDMLAEFFAARGYGVTTLNGGMDLEERRRVQRDYAGDARLLISTEAGGEGLNLQFCHLVVNYDLPWNPMRLEQRIGRVDRIGQTLPVRAFNLTIESSVEHRIQEVLEEKLRTILNDLGVDKLGDVLDSGDVEADFERLHREALLHPDAVDAEVAELAERLRQQGTAAHSGAALLRGTAAPDLAATRATVEHPLPRWVEALTVNAVRDADGIVTRQLGGYDVDWPDGQRWSNVTFARSGLDAGAERLITLFDPRLQTVAVLAISGLAAGVSGVWSLWQLAASAGERRYQRYLPLFLRDNGLLLAPSARRVWEVLTAPETRIAARGVLETGEATRCWDRLQHAAYEQATALYTELASAHQTWLKQEQERMRLDVAARRELAQRSGLAGVREHRLERLDAEERRAQAALDTQAELLAEVTAVVVFHVEPFRA